MLTEEITLHRDGFFASKILPLSMKEKVAKTAISPFLKVIDSLLSNGMTHEKFSNVTTNNLSKILLKGGWDQAHNAHFFNRLFDPNRAGSCGINSMFDFAMVLRNGFQFGPDKWVDLRSRTMLIVNFKKQRFVTTLVLGDENKFWQEYAGSATEGFGKNMTKAKTISNKTSVRG